MPKIVNSWDEWDPLKRVIVGRPEGTSVPAPEPAWWYDLPHGGYPQFRKTCSAKLPGHAATNGSPSRRPCIQEGWCERYLVAPSSAGWRSA